MNAGGETTEPFRDGTTEDKQAKGNTLKQTKCSEGKVRLITVITQAGKHMGSSPETISSSY